MSITIDGSGTITGATTMASTIASPTLTTPALGTPSAIVLTNATAVPYTGFKNRIINGAMVIDQRNAGASVPTPTNGQYCLDRWRAFTSGGGVYSIGQSTTAPTGFTHSSLLTVTTADASVAATDYYVISQPIEAYNMSDFMFGSASAQTVSVSFWVRASITGTYGGCLRNNAGDYNYPFTYTIAVANTFEYKTVTVTGATAGTWLTLNSKGAEVWFSVGTGADYTDVAGAWTTKSGVISANSSTNLISTNGATFYLTGVQLETGSTATAFDYRPHGTELALCQRYYVQLQKTASSTELVIAGAMAGGTSFLTMLPYAMRSAPTVTFNTSAAVRQSTGVYNVSSWAGYQDTPNHVILNATTASSISPDSAANAYSFQQNCSLSAEL